MPTLWLIKGGGRDLGENTTQPNPTLHQSFLHHAGMDKRQKKQWDKMTKQWDEIRGLARAAGERDDQARATAARVRQEALAKMAALRNEAKAKEAPRSSNPIPNVPTERSPQHPPEGETPPLCWCMDPCKFFKSKHPLSLGMRYWGCANYSCDYPDRRWDTRSYRQPVRSSYSMFPYLFSSKVGTNNLSRLPVVPGSAMWLPQVDRPGDPPT